MDKNLFKSIGFSIRHERLYAQIDLSREDIMQRFNIGRHRLNNMLNDFADGMSFPQYINAIRLEVAYDLLTNHPEKTTSRCGTRSGLHRPEPARAVQALLRYHSL